MIKIFDISKASKLSYVLGKHEWEVTGDVFECNNGMSYITDIKVIIKEVDLFYLSQFNLIFQINPNGAF